MKRITEYKALAYRLTLAYIFYFLSRLSFYCFNQAHLRVEGIGDFFRLAFYGLLFDTTAIIYVNLLFIFLSVLPLLINTKKSFQKVLFWVYFACNIPAYLLNFIDIVYFSYNKTRLTTNDWALVENEHNPLTLMVGFLVQYWAIFAVFLVLIVLWIFLYRKVQVREEEVTHRRPYFIISAIVLVLLAPTLIFGIRGFSFKAGVIPLTVMDASKYARDISQVNILLNTPFTIFRTMGKNKGFKEFKFTTDAYIAENIKPIKRYGRQVKDQPNIVVIILEGMGAEYFGVMNQHTHIPNYRSHTPFLDSLARQGYYFTNIFSNSIHSIEGISAVTAGMPTFQTAWVRSGYAQRKVSSLPEIARSLGYQTLFAHGATNGSMNFDGYTHQIGYQTYLGRTEFNDDRYYNGSWGIDDEPFLQYFAKNINQMKRPFLATVFTLSSHGPYTVPDKYKNQFNTGDIPMHNVTEYTDLSLLKFFDTIKKEDWYANTIFAIISDHTTDDYYDYYKQKIAHHRLPIILFSPNKALIPQGSSDTLGQQIDIFPTLVDLMGYQKPFRSWGRSLLSDKADEIPRAFVTHTQFYQLIQGNYIYVLDLQGKVVGVYAKEDLDLIHNLKDQITHNEEMKKGIADMRAFMQDYMDRIIHDKLE
ncbi:LTA synthase family protein [Capnocytophaga sp. oral taxon 338]|uniref:LTA synthase family protein n=1 Tax=Capnocytophaga sp. oral taxon 338 TaxID=710239 RepID=UPI000202D166|nr:sulfatase-like hydrolase/transferase [Capnocytophaga sp. oral taxon 338]EGD34522.1 membrane protein [Capnocytophaga sp. oral taxon 338 str. F0234]